MSDHNYGRGRSGGTDRKFSDRRRDDEPVGRRAYNSANSRSQPVRAPVVSVAPPLPPKPKPEPVKPDFGITTPDCGRWSSDGRYWVFDPPKAEAKDWDTRWKR